MKCLYSFPFFPLRPADKRNRWFFSSTRVVYAIHGGPMAGRKNYQEASYQCVRPGELWQCNWLEGMFCSLLIPNVTSTPLTPPPHPPPLPSPTPTPNSLHHRNRHNLLPNLRHPHPQNNHPPRLLPRSLGQSHLRPRRQAKPS